MWMWLRGPDRRCFQETWEASPAWWAAKMGLVQVRPACRLTQNICHLICAQQVTPSPAWLLDLEVACAPELRSSSSHCLHSAAPRGPWGIRAHHVLHLSSPLKVEFRNSFLLLFLVTVPIWAAFRRQMSPSGGLFSEWVAKLPRGGRTNNQDKIYHDKEACPFVYWHASLLQAILKMTISFARW